MLQLPWAWGSTSQVAFVLSRVVIGAAVTLSLMLLGSGIYQIASTSWRVRSLGRMDLEMVCRLAYIGTACLGLLTYCWLTKIWLALKLWLCLAASLLCLAASVFQCLRHGFQLTRASVWTAAVSLLLAMVNSVALSIVHLEMQLPHPHPHPQSSLETRPAPQAPQQQRLYLSDGDFFQRRSQPQPAVDLAACVEDQQILRAPQITHLPTAVHLRQPSPPPIYALTAPIFEAAALRPPEYSQIYPGL